MPTPQTIRESHEIVRRVLDGDVDPQCQRAQRAYRVAKRFPNPVMVEGFQEPPNVYRPRPIRKLKRHAPSQAKDTAGRDVVMGLLFGSAAPQATKAIELLSTPRGKRVVGVGTTALATLLITRISQ